ncbi:hypothetical protein M2302_000265 [Micromonospora sp. A200]|uniref:hypothetical protein n=1 Tax=Micromonospora sp. A200 TaxID=2940568 RepID=UPI0024744D2E|nr:hypothetical protein [Micromonospora sp. A200]MDH6460114.1 hypothetical protein [Micromonospora sp. A200]
MGHLGSFGAALRELDPGADRDTFDFFGESFTVEGVMPPIQLFQLSAAILGGERGTSGMAAMWGAFRAALTKPAEDGKRQDDSQFDRFYRLAVLRKCDTDSLMDLAFNLFEAQTGRPTVEPRGSSAGQSTTSPSASTSSSTHPALAHLRPVEAVLAG